jgi:methyl-accepting chemotaxis protein/methyl-accepting chemotaxis protein-1 (serine sensor receptor)
MSTLKVSTKLYSIVGVLALAALLASATGSWYLRTLGEELSLSTGKTAPKLDLVNAARARAWELVATLRGMSLAGKLDNQSEFDADSRRADSVVKRMGDQVNELRPLMTTEDDRRDLGEFESGVRGIAPVTGEYKRICGERQWDQLAGLGPKLQNFVTMADTTLNRLKDHQRKFLKESQERSASLRAQSMVVNSLFGFVLVCMIGLVVVVVRSTCRTLVSVIDDLSEGADQVAASAGQVSSASQSLAQGSSEQAASLEETSASSEEIKSSSRRNSQNAQGAADLVTRSLQKFEETDRLLGQTVMAMGEISAHSEKISKINKVIDEVAFQTNILALNAAVEAARAGEAGMGFAVVADEVRNLSQRCAQAARDTAELIAESIARSRDGKVKVDQVAAAMHCITEEDAKLKTLVDNVYQGNQEQTLAIEQIGKAITQMEQVTQTAAAGSQQSAAAAEELSAQSETLQHALDQLRIMVGSHKGEARREPDKPASRLGAF